MSSGFRVSNAKEVAVRVAAADPRAPARGVSAGWSRNCGCFGTWEPSRCFSPGAAAHCRTAVIKRAKRFLFYKLDPVPRLSPHPPPPPGACSGGQWAGVVTAREIRTPVIPTQAAHRCPAILSRPGVVDSSGSMHHTPVLGPASGRFLKVRCSHAGPYSTEHSCACSQIAAVSG